MNIGIASLLLALAIATIADLRVRRVPNTLIFTGIIAATGINILSDLGYGGVEPLGGATSITHIISGIAIGFIALFPLYALRAMGAGDVKLMMMVGAFLGPLQTLGVVVLTFAAGGVLAIAMALWQRSFRQLVFNLRFMLTTSAISAAGGMSPKFEPLQQTAGRMPYAVAIAAGTLLQLYLVRNGGWALS